ncbi:MAG: NAD(P)/FAD-dependent oxidoreductase [Promethearchaeota archaeon]
MFDIAVVGAGIAGSSFALKASHFAKVILIDAIKDIESFPVKVNLFIEHNKPFVETIENFPWSKKTIFPRFHDKIRFMGDKVDGYMDSAEFGDPYGRMVNTHNLLKWIVEKFQNNGGIAEFNKTVTKIKRTADEVIIKAGKEDYKVKMVVLATGSNAYHLQSSLGFSTPDRYMGVYANLYGDPDLIDDKINTTYTFNINTKISKSGPLFINKGLENICTGYLGDFNASVDEIVKKMERILASYRQLQPLIQGLKIKEKPQVVAISKHPIKEFSQDRALILGEAAGLVTAFFYEGLVCGLCCADAAAKTLESLINSNSNLNKQDLQTYDAKIKHTLLSAFFRNGHASEYMFYSSPSAMRILWDTYLSLINTNKRLRKYIYDVHFLQDLSQYDIGRDRWAGERIYAKLPLGSKIALGPKFLKAMFKL